MNLNPAKYLLLAATVLLLGLGQPVRAELALVSPGIDADGNPAEAEVELFPPAPLEPGGTSAH